MEQQCEHVHLGRGALCCTQCERGMPRRKKGTDKKKEPKKGGESGGASGAAAGKSRTPNSSKSEHRDAGRAGHVSSDSKGDEVLKRVKQNKDADLSAPVAPVEVAEGEKEGDRLRSVVACMCQCVCVISVTIVLLSLVGPRVASFLDPDRELLARATDSDLFKSLLANLSLHIPPRPVSCPPALFCPPASSAGG